jgi:hypothetical protein
MNDDANEQFEECIEWPDGSKRWYLHNKRHRKNAPAVEWNDGSEEWYQHGKLHRENGAAVVWMDGSKEWYLHGTQYQDANAWAKDVLKMRNEPCDEMAVEDYLRTILTKDDLI